MKSFARLAALLICLAGAPAFAAPELPAWLDPAASLSGNADRARRDGIDPTTATVELIRSGHAAPPAVAAVVVAYDRCDALYASVEAGARAEPAKALEIAEAVEATGRCPCNADDLWTRTRLERRLRLEIRAEPVGTPQPCLCQAAVAEALARAVPGRADELYDGMVDGGRRCDCAASMLAGLANGTGTESPFMVAQRRIAELSLRSDGRVLDVVAAKDAQAESTLLDRSEVHTATASTDCRAPWVDVDSARVEADLRCGSRARTSVAIDAYRGDGRKRGVEIVNRGRDAIDLAALPLVLDVYDPADERPARTIPLAGRLEPGERVRVATEERPRGFDEVEIESDDLAIERVSMVALRQPREPSTCAAEVAAVLDREGPIPIAAPPGTEIVGEPRTDESVIDPNRGGDLASPN